MKTIHKAISTDLGRCGVECGGGIVVVAKAIRPLDGITRTRLVGNKEGTRVVGQRSRAMWHITLTCMACEDVVKKHGFSPVCHWAESMRSYGCDVRGGGGG